MWPSEWSGRLPWDPEIPGLKTRANHWLSPWFNFSAALVNSQLACLRPVGILNSCCSQLPCSVVSLIVIHWPRKAPMGRDQLRMYCYNTVITDVRLQFGNEKSDGKTKYK